MKRPSGFDRAPEPRRPERRASGASDEASTAQTASGELGSGASEPEAAVRSSLLSRRIAAAKRSESAGAPPATEEPRLSDVGIGPGESEHLAPTVDLGEVREVHEIGESSKVREASEVREIGEVRGIGEIRRAGVDEGANGAGSVLSRLRGQGDADPVRAAERRVREAERAVRKREKREKRRFSVHSRRRRRNWLIAGGAVVALALFVAVGVFTPVMAVRDVQVVGADTVNRADVEKTLQRFEGTPLALIDDDDVRGTLEAFPLIQRYAIERQPPHTLVVRIEERVPVIAIKNGKKFELHDAAGVLVDRKKKRPAGVPLGAGTVTDLESEAFASASRALRDMPSDLRKQITQVTAKSGQDVTFTLKSGIEVLWGDAGQTRRKAVVLQTMMASLQDRPVQQIDVSSFEAPVFK